MFKGNAELQHGASNLMWLRAVRDRVLQEEMRWQVQQEMADAALARQLQRAEIRESLEKEEAREKAMLVSLERKYQASLTEEALRAGSFKSLVGRFEFELHDKAKGDPNFDDFDRYCAKLAKRIELAFADVSAAQGQKVDQNLLYKTVGKVIKALEKTLGTLGDASDIDLGDGIRKCHLHKMGSLVWRLGRKLSGGRLTANELAGLRVRLHRLQFLLRWVMFDHEKLEIDPHLLASLERKQRETNSKIIASFSQDVDWACPACTMHNKGQHLCCEACGKVRSSVLQGGRLADYGAGWGSGWGFGGLGG